MRISRLVVSVVSMAFAMPAIAQDGFPAVDMTGMGIYAMQDSVMQAAQGTVTRRPGPQAVRRPAPLPAASMIYRPSIERRRANIDAMLDKMSKQDPEGAAKMRQRYRTMDPIEAIAKIAGPQFGVNIHNVADAYAMWWIDAWMSSHGQFGAPTRGQVRAVSMQAASALAAVPAFRTANDVTKQQLAEALLMETVVIDGLTDANKNDPAKVRALSSAIKQGARKSGIDLDSMTLTETGFVMRGRG